MMHYHIEKRVRESLKKSALANLQNKRRRRILLDMIPDKVAAERIADMVCPKGKMVTEGCWIWIVSSLQTNKSFVLCGGGRRA